MPFNRSITQSMDLQVAVQAAIAAAALQVNKELGKKARKGPTQCPPSP